MRTVLRLLLWLLGLGALFLPVFPDPPLTTGAYVQQVTASGAVIARIEAGRRELVCEVRDGAGGLVAQVRDGVRRRHAFAIEGLRAGQRYDYALLAAGARIDGGSFVTPPPDDAAPVRLAVVGDSGGQPWWIDLRNAPIAQLPIRFGWLPPDATVAGIGAAMAAERPDLWLHVGDVVYPRGVHALYGSAFFAPFAELLRSAPCYAVIGNHDIDGDGGRPFLQNFHLPTNDWTGDERMFSVAWGPVRIVGADLQGALTTQHPALPFLEQALAQATEPWVIVFAHYPFLSASRHRDRGDLQELLVPVLLRHRVDLLLAGHDHNYQRFGDPHAPHDAMDRLVLVISGGGGKSLYELREHPRLRFAHGGYQYCVVEVDGLRLTLRAKDAQGGVLEEFAIDKRRLIEEGSWVLDPANARDRRINALR